jgi:hypothetical protein
MIKRIYRMEDLEESAELLRQGPPWWVHVALFALIFILLATASVVGVIIRNKVRSQSRRQPGTEQSVLLRAGRTERADGVREATRPPTDEMYAED